MLDHEAEYWMANAPPSHAHTGSDGGLRRRLSCSSGGLQLLTGKKPASLVWGRRYATSLSTSIACAGMVLFCPSLVIFAWIALEHFNGSLAASAAALVARGPVQFLAQFGPHPCGKAFAGYVVWLLVQAALYNYLPGNLGTGQRTPAGYLLQYYTNGLRAWIVTHVVFLTAAFYGVIDGAILAKNWMGLLVAANLCGLLLSAGAYAKAQLAPTHAEDRKFSGSRFYDFYMGIEFNPRLGKYWDFKLFTNGRPGIIAWTLIDLSFMAYQYELHGSITNSMIIAVCLHGIYVVDFFFYEDWYLRTIDICHDHFGFYLAWGSLVWLPSMYTLQTQHLARYPRVLSVPAATLIFAMGLVGYSIFRGVNNQKDLVRHTNGDCLIWGQQARVIRCQYRTKDGKDHETLLLCSGWWGFSRHANYLGDLVLSYSMCATCGFQHLLPWFYAIFMTVLLLHRCRRSEARCAAKYGDSWRTYCAEVRWRLVPGVY